MEPKLETRDHQHYQELVAGAAFGILTPKELADFSAYLMTSAGVPLRQELAELQAVVEEIPLSLDERVPSPALRDRLQTAIQADIAMNVPSVTSVTPMDIFTPRTRTPSSVSDKSPSSGPNAIVPLPQAAPKPRFGMRMLSPAMWAIAAIALVAILAGAVFGGYRLADSRQDVSDGGEQIALNFTTPPAADVSAELRYYKDRDLLVLSTHNMPAAPADHVYQVWLIDADGAKPVGVMGPDGFASLTNVSAYQTLAITVEPAPLGSAGPTTDPIVVAPLDGIST